MEKFIVRYEVKGVKKSRAFDATLYDEAKASEYLKAQGVQNFMFFWEPYGPVNLDESTVLLRGDVGFDITTERILPHLAAGKDIVFDSFGGSLWEGLKMYDTVKLLKPKTKVGVLGSAASAITPIILAFPPEQRWMTPNSRFLVHNPWAWEAGDDAQMRAAANMLEKEKLNLAAIYVNETGNSQEDILNLMKQERFLDFAETKSFNFIINQNTNFKNDEMEKTEMKAKLSGLEAVLAKVSNALKPSPKNLVLQDVDGVELDFGEDIETQEQVVVGVTATADGEPADGDFVMDDGTTYTFAAGTLETITPPEGEGDEEMEALKQENADLKQQLADAQNSVTALTTERKGLKADVAEANKQLGTFQNQLAELKNEFSNDTPPVNTPPVSQTKVTKRR